MEKEYLELQQSMIFKLKQELAFENKDDSAEFNLKSKIVDYFSDNESLIMMHIDFLNELYKKPNSLNFICDKIKGINLFDLYHDTNSTEILMDEVLAKIGDDAYRDSMFEKNKANNEVVVFNIDGESFLLSMGKVSKEEKMDIAMLSDNIPEFIENAHDKSTFEIMDEITEILDDKFYVNSKIVPIAMQVEIYTENFEIVNEVIEYKGSNWFKGRIDGYEVDAKVYSKPSYLGIDNGIISKLEIRDGDTKIVSYDRGWNIEPDLEHVEVYQKAVELLKQRRKEIDAKGKEDISR